MSTMDREEMRALIERIYRAGGSAEEAARDLALFIENCRHPSSIDILFWPELVPELRGRVPSVEEAVELALCTSQ